MQKIYKILVSLLLATHFISAVLAQNTILQEARYPKSNELQAQYYVLSNAPTIKHGKYTSYFELSDADRSMVYQGIKTMASFVKEEGNYKNGKKDGTWVTYDNNSGAKVSADYSDGARKSYIISRHRIIHGKTYIKDIKEEIDSITNTVVSSWQSVSFIGINYPESARVERVNDKVFINYQVDNACNMTKIWVRKGFQADCDAEALRLVKAYLKEMQTLEPNWCQGKFDLPQTISIYFRID